MKDKENTTQVTLFRDAVDTDWYEAAYQRFRASEGGAKILAEKRDLYSVLTDTDYLMTLPEGSLGRLYYEFSQEQGITPDGFRNAYRGAGRPLEDLGPERALVHYRLLDMHDILHIVTGYGRDGFGEVCILQFQGEQFKTFGLRLLSYLAIPEVWRLKNDIPASKCVFESQRIAREAKDMATADWELLLTRPLDEVRKTLNVSLPELYLSRYDDLMEYDRSYRESLAAGAA